MQGIPRLRLRRVWLDVHLWIGVGLGVLLTVVGVSGSLLVWHDPLDEILTPHRYAVTGAEVGQPLSAYLAAAAAATPEGVSPVSLRMPEHPGGPVRVIARGAAAREGARPPVWSVWLDPPTARVLDAAEGSSTVIGFLHVLHGSLAIPQYSGRQIVGWSGVAMLISACTGLYLWWPRKDFVRALGWRRGFTVSANLHRLLGFWICVPLAILSITGIYLSFPQTARSMMSSIAPMSPQQQRQNFNAPPTPAKLSPDAAAKAALEAAGAGAQLATLAPPAGRSGAWRVQVRLPGAEEPSTTVTVEDASGAAKLAAPRGEPLAGDAAARLIRRIHDGDGMGIVWQAIVFLGGVLPALFAVTGVMMWLRRRRARRAMARRRPSSPLPAAAE